MLVLSRKTHERIFIGSGRDTIIVSVERIEQGQVRLGIAAPRDVKILREEINGPGAAGDGGTRTPQEPH